MNVFQAIRVLSLRHVIKENDLDYTMRRIYRWYSKTFHTPLHVVEDLPVEFILQNYWEAQYEDMDDQSLDHEVKTLTKTPEETRAEDKAWDEQQAEEVEFAKMAGTDIGKKDGKIADLKPIPIKGLVPESQTQQSSTEMTMEKIGAVTEILNNIKELPPDVHMTFGEVPIDDNDSGEDSIPVPVKPK